MLCVINKIINGLLSLLGILLIIVIGLSVWNVIGRYVFSEAVLWADEVSTFSVIIFAYLGLIVSAWRGVDIRMDILLSILPKQAVWIIQLLQQAVIIALCGWVSYLSLGYVQRVYRVGMTSTAADLPLWIIHGMIPLGFLLVSLIAVVRISRLLCGKTDSLTAIEDSVLPKPTTKPAIVSSPKSVPVVSDSKQPKTALQNAHLEGATK